MRSDRKRKRESDRCETEQGEGDRQVGEEAGEGKEWTTRAN